MLKRHETQDFPLGRDFLTLAATRVVTSARKPLPPGSLIRWLIKGPETEAGRLGVSRSHLGAANDAAASRRCREVGLTLEILRDSLQRCLKINVDAWQ